LEMNGKDLSGSRHPVGRIAMTESVKAEKTMTRKQGDLFV